ncbi:MAG TPA: PQQ-binding-like beta-propeller repeat protein, partial [Pirellulaceae bacterium]|nr:PQQ-binding-like beta-propeller repeat protein [Pirellulaceae bacterium]
MPGLRTLALLTLLLCPSLAGAEDWPAWRGPRGDGTSTETNVPTTWNGATGEHIKWKVPTPGNGHASPIVWQDRIFITACVNDTQERVLTCLDRASGKTLWTKTVVKAPLEKKHDLNSYASGTPATDGKLIYVTFLAADFGSNTQRTPGDMIVAAYDFNGEQKWQAKPGRFASVHGFCSSPVLFEETVIINGDHDGDAYIVALNKQTGAEVWKVARANKTRSYVTPIIREIDGRTQMIFSGSKSVTSLDPRTGTEHWSMKGPTEQFVASLVYNGDMLFLTAGFPERHILAIKPDGKGDVTDTHIAWRTTKAASYVPSPIVVGDYFFVASDDGLVSCFEAATGKRHWLERLGKHYSASLVTANGLVYFLADDGIMKIVRPGPKLDVIAENPLDEYIYASPA